MKTKDGRTISAATQQRLERAMGHLKASADHEKKAAEERTKGLGVLRNLSEGIYADDVNDPNPAGKSEQCKSADLAAWLAEAEDLLCQ